MEKPATSTAKITRQSIVVLAHVALFVLVYLLTIALGAALVYVAFHACRVGIPVFIEQGCPFFLQFGRFGFFIIFFCAVLVIGLWTFILALGIYLLKPLFIFPKNNKDHGRELQREDAPQLYDLIINTAKEVGVKPPRHIYIDPSANAYVFFNTGFWNIFLPVRKNLTIGLGLMKRTSVAEFKSMIAHEFGHFAQNSMRVGSVLYVTNKVISDLVYRRDAMDRYLTQWCLKSGVWGMWGKVTQKVIVGIRSMTEFFFKLQQKKYMELSRQMEYDADAVACRVCGSRSFASGICKSVMIERSFEFYNHILRILFSKSVSIDDYWKGYDITCNCASTELKIASFDKALLEPLEEDSKSSIEIEDVWNSHPTTAKRVEHAMELDIPNSDSRDKTPELNKAAWELLPYQLTKEISDKIIPENIRNASSHKVNWEELEREIPNIIELMIIPSELDSLLNRDFVCLDYDTETSDNQSISDKNSAEKSQDDNPESQENKDRNEDKGACEPPLLTESELLSDQTKELVEEYEQALKDKALLQMLSDGKIPVKKFRYRGKEVGVDEVPIGEHMRYIEALKGKIIHIEKSLRSVLLSKTKEPDMVEAAYKALQYCQKTVEALKNDFVPVRDDIVKEYTEGTITGEEDFESLLGWLQSYEYALKDTLKSVQLDKIEPFTSKEDLNHIRRFMESPCSFNYGIQREAINLMFSITDWILRVHNNPAHYIKKYFADILQDKDISAPEFLISWLDDQQQQKMIKEAEKADGLERAYIKVETESRSDTLKFVVPTEEEIDTVYYQEVFRAHIVKKLREKPEEHELSFEYVCTVPYTHDAKGHITCADEKHKDKFYAELEEYNKFLINIRAPRHYVEDEAKAGDAYALGLIALERLRQSNYKYAYEYAVRGSLLGDTISLTVLGVLFRDGLEVQADRKTAIQLFKYAAARGGNQLALYYLGMEYLNSDYQYHDLAKAFSYIGRAAEQGLPMAECQFGVMGLKGEGIDQPDSEFGLWWLLRAASDGYLEAVNHIWKYFKSIGNTDSYLQMLKKGASFGLQECIDELKSYSQQSHQQNQ